MIHALLTVFSLSDMDLEFIKIFQNLLIRSRYIIPFKYVMVGAMWGPTQDLMIRWMLLTSS
jgi:hypothetical protein